MARNQGRLACATMSRSPVRSDLKVRSAFGAGGCGDDDDRIGSGSRGPVGRAGSIGPSSWRSRRFCPSSSGLIPWTAAQASSPIESKGITFGLLLLLTARSGAGIDEGRSNSLAAAIVAAARVILLDNAFVPFVLDLSWLARAAALASATADTPRDEVRMPGVLVRPVGNDFLCGLLLSTSSNRLDILASFELQERRLN